MDWICEEGNLCENKLYNLKVNGQFAELSDDEEEGYLETPVVETEKFTEITPSWNSITDSHSSVEVLIRVRVESVWTPYISYGVWSVGGNNTGIKNYYSDEIIRGTEDRIFIKNGKLGDAAQIKVFLRGKNPRLRLVAFSTDGGEDEEVQGNYLQVLEGVPLISQIVSGHKDARVICSPTSLTMVLKYHGKNVELDQVAAGTYDLRNDAYGNWPQNTAFAGEMGMRAYTRRCKSINPVKNYIAKGMPVVASVCMKEKDMLDGAYSAFPTGHLMVAVGFSVKEGVEYIVVNDPAASSDEEVRKQYRLDQWIKVWRHYIYSIIPNVEK